MQKNTKYPMSMFESVKTPQVEEYLECDFHEFSQIMQSYSEEEFNAKEDAPLFAVTQFNGDYRKKANATASGLIVLDIDHDLVLEEVISTIKAWGIAGLIYTTASHRNDHHKFRVCIPLENAVDYETHVACWHAVNFALTDAGADTSKVGSESLFYVPGRYRGAPQVFCSFEGDTYPAEDWVALAGPDGQPQVTAKAPSNPKTYVSTPPMRQTGSGGGRTANEFDLDIYETRLVTDAAISKYRSSFGNWHHARFGLMRSIAGRAAAMCIHITSEDIVVLFNQVDLIDGGYYQSDKYQQEIINDAVKAVAQTV